MLRPQGDALISAQGIKFTFLGFPTTVNWFFFLLPAFWLSSIQFDRLAPGVSAIGVVMAYVGAMFVGVYGHELGHAVAARSIGAEARIELILFGGLTSWSTGREIAPRERLRVSLAGPLVGVAIGALSWVVMNALPSVRVEVSAFLQVLTQVALVWGIFNLIPFPGFDGGHSLDAFLEIITPGSALRVGAIVKGVASLLGIVAAWYFFGPLSALILGLFVFRGGASPLTEYRRSLDADSKALLDRAIDLLREGRLDASLELVEKAGREARYEELRDRAQAVRLPLLLWLGRWDELAGMPADLFDPSERGLVLMRAGRLQDAEVALRTAPASGRRSAFLAECLARQEVAITSEDAAEGAQADLMVAHAKSLAGRDPDLASRVAEFGLELPDITPADRVTALIVARRFEDARLVAGSVGPSAVWLVDAVLAADDGGLGTVLVSQRDPSVLAMLQSVLHHFEQFDSAFEAGRAALDRGATGIVRYNTACSALRSGRTEIGLEMLAGSIEEGVEAQRAISDRDFAQVRGTDAFARALSTGGAVGSAEI